MIIEFQTLSFIFSVWILFLQAPCVFVHFTFSFRQLSFKPVVSWLSTCAKIKAEVVAPSSTSARLQVCPIFQFFIRYSHIYKHSFFRDYITITEINSLKILMWAIFCTGLVSLPFIPIYCATKSGVLSYTKAVAVRCLFLIWLFQKKKRIMYFNFWWCTCMAH